jgi:dimethylglycine dehydrogenase
VIDAEHTDATGYEPIFRGDELVGYVTSGGYGHCVQKSLAMGYLASSVKTESEDLTVTLLGDQRPARLTQQALIDPTGHQMRL